MTLGPGSKLGANFQHDGTCSFLVWAPFAGRIDLHLISPSGKLIPMASHKKGYFSACVDNLAPGARYLYQIDRSLERPDPASRFQPEGVHGPSEVVDPRFSWSDGAWKGIELRDYVLYELHTGTFTERGDFDAILQRLGELKELGITAIELMPVSQFPGSRNWGYDGAYPFAVQESYGGPAGLKRLVDAAHATGLAVVLDVVYNHLGPEGNYLAQYGPYFTDSYRTPWGEAINFDGEHGDEVRRYFIENALYWISEFHIDALRLDAVHAIRDASARPFLAELADEVHTEGTRLGRRVYLMPESNQNDARLVLPHAAGGYDLDAVWSDDFHHAVHVVLTAERDGYYADFGSMAQLAKAISEGFVYAGQYSEFRRRRHGNSSRAIPAERFVVFTQNHDQIGNRIRGDRLSTVVSFDALKLAAGLMFASPFLPLLFMGEEYGETAPFPYFVSHGDPALIEAVRTGRREEFARFDWQGEMPDPQSEQHFVASRLNWELRKKPPHAQLRLLYKEMLRLRREHPVWRTRDKDRLEVTFQEKLRLLILHRWTESAEALGIFCFEKEPTKVTGNIPSGRWTKALDSSDAAWAGGGSSVPGTLESKHRDSFEFPPLSFALFDKASRED